MGIEDDLLIITAGPKPIHSSELAQDSEKIPL